MVSVLPGIWDFSILEDLKTFLLHDNSISNFVTITNSLLINGERK